MSLRSCSPFSLPLAYVLPSPVLGGSKCLGIGLSTPVAVAVASKDIRVYFGTQMAYIVAMTFMLATGVAFLWDLGSPSQRRPCEFLWGKRSRRNVFGAALVLIPVGPYLDHASPGFGTERRPEMVWERGDATIAYDWDAERAYDAWC